MKQGCTLCSDRGGEIRIRLVNYTPCSMDGYAEIAVNRYIRMKASIGQASSFQGRFGGSALSMAQQTRSTQDPMAQLTTQRLPLESCGEYCEAKKICFQNVW